jgi:hypothetical protein
MSVSPAQKRSKPVPVPEVAISIPTSSFSSRNCSDASDISGPTAVEPSAVIAAVRD